MKLYILVKEDLEPGMAMCAVAHAVLAGHLKFKDEPDYQDWLANSFKKCVCKVSQGEFDSAKKLEKNLVMTESSLGGIETAIVFCPRQKDKIEKNFRFYKLWK